MTAYTITIGILFTLWLLPALAIIGLYLGELLRDRFGRTPSWTSDGPPPVVALRESSNAVVQTYSTTKHAPGAVLARGPVGRDRRFSLDSVQRVQVSDASRPASILHWQVHMN